MATLLAPFRPCFSSGIRSSRGLTTVTAAKGGSGRGHNTTNGKENDSNREERTRMEGGGAWGTRHRSVSEKHADWPFSVGRSVTDSLHNGAIAKRKKQEMNQQQI